MSNVLTYEDIKPKVSKDLGKRVALKELDHYHSSTLVWHLVVRHKFGLVLTTLIVYVAFNSFGTLLVGLFESLK